MAFNIQSHDTIKYSSKNVGAEIETAIRDAIKLTNEKKKENSYENLVNKSILRKLELAGFEITDKNWILSNVIEDTAFKGFMHRDKNFNAHVGKIDNLIDIQTYIDDLGVVIYRTERKIKSLQEEYDRLNEQCESIAKTIAGEYPMLLTGHYASRPESPLQEKFNSIQSKIAVYRTTLKRASKIFLAFIVNPKIDLSTFPETCNLLVKEHSRYIITISRDSKIKFEDTSVDLYNLESSSYPERGVS